MTATEPLRRVDDQRAAELADRLARVEAGVAVLTERVTTLIGRLDTDILRRIAASESHHADQDQRIDVLEQRWDQLSGAVGLVKVLIGTSVAAIVIGLVGLWLQVRPSASP